MITKCIINSKLFLRKDYILFLRNLGIYLLDNLLKIC